MRAAFTIIFNGLHHLQHNNYAEFLLNRFDYWAVVEGASGNTGSTGWCHSMPGEYHTNGASVDGTREYLDELQKKHPNLLLVKSDGLWSNKDEQVNRAIDELEKVNHRGYLWEIDIDEQWTDENMAAAENMLTEKGARTGEFYANHFVGKDIVARGYWGEGKGLPYRRLWDWKGERFARHEPPELEGGNDPTELLPQYFNHYSYYFEKDVAFKDKWYGGHQGIHRKWLELQKETTFPQPISRLIRGHYGRSATTIEKI